MNPKIEAQYKRVLRHLYINPLERCNLRCKICYTRKTDPILTKEEILTFVDHYQKVQLLESITLCGGEVFALPYFPTLVNTLTAQGLFVQVITNGTIDTLSEFSHPNRINVIVSIDGLPEYHDANRGEGNCAKSISFLKKAHDLGFHTEIFSIVTRQNYELMDAFEKYLAEILGRGISVTYHPRKPPQYLTHHPVSNIVGSVEGFDFLTPEQLKHVMRERKSFPPKDLGCFQIAVASDGKVYGCCEGTVPLGVMTDSPNLLLKRLYERLVLWDKTSSLHTCLGCSQPDFVCGIRAYLEA